MEVVNGWGVISSRPRLKSYPIVFKTTFEIVDKYYYAMLDYGLSPFRPPVPFSSDEVKKYLANPNQTAFVAPFGELDDALKKVCKHLKDIGVLDKAILYPWDEPNTRPGARRQGRFASGGDMRIADPPHRGLTFAPGGLQWMRSNHGT